MFNIYIMLTKHNVYSVKVMFFWDFGKVFLIYFMSDSVFSSFRGVQDRFSLENLDHSPTILSLVSLALWCWPLWAMLPPMPLLSACES